MWFLIVFLGLLKLCDFSRFSGSKFVAAEIPDIQFTGWVDLAALAAAIPRSRCWKSLLLDDLPTLCQILRWLYQLHHVVSSHVIM